MICHLVYNLIHYSTVDLGFLIQTCVALLGKKYATKTHEALKRVLMDSAIINVTLHRSFVSFTSAYEHDSSGFLVSLSTISSTKPSDKPVS